MVMTKLLEYSVCSVLVMFAYNKISFFASKTKIKLVLKLKYIRKKSKIRNRYNQVPHGVCDVFLCLFHFPIRCPVSGITPDTGHRIGK